VFLAVDEAKQKTYLYVKGPAGCPANGVACHGEIARFTFGEPWTPRSSGFLLIVVRTQCGLTAARRTEALFSTTLAENGKGAGAAISR